MGFQFGAAITHKMSHVTQKTFCDTSWIPMLVVSTKEGQHLKWAYYQVHKYQYETCALFALGHSNLKMDSISKQWCTNPNPDLI